VPTPILNWLASLDGKWISDPLSFTQGLKTFTSRTRNLIDHSTPAALVLIAGEPVQEWRLSSSPPSLSRPAHFSSPSLLSGLLPPPF
jgi:hypothetical protein